MPDNDPYCLVTIPYLPVYAPLRGWRKVAAFFRLPVQRSSFVWFGGNSRMYCHPETLPVLQGYLIKNKIAYTTELTVVQGAVAGK